MKIVPSASAGARRALFDIAASVSPAHPTSAGPAPFPGSRTARANPVIASAMPAAKSMSVRNQDPQWKQSQLEARTATAPSATRASKNRRAAR
jgi:hypothetical protein